MVREVEDTTVFFACSCGNRVEGTRDDRRIKTGGQRSASKDDKYAAIIASAPLANTVLRVDVQCPGCGLPYMTQVRVSEEETIIRTCECGHRERVRG
jgi:DNA-directed RNA polymerase subunit M/transcription elongation factor TFIIS